MSKKRTVIQSCLICAAVALIIPPTLAQGNAGSPVPQDRSAKVQSVKIEVTTNGFEPNSFQLKAGVPARVMFLRRTDDTCATSVVIPDYSIKRDLPLNEPVTVEFTPEKAGQFSFRCGMGMRHGEVIVQ